MFWFNVVGFLIILAIMIPNIFYAFKCKDGFKELWKNKTVEVFEQIGRFGCFILMIFNIPHCYLGFWFENAFVVYAVVNAVLVVFYCSIWTICFKKNSIFRALSLSILPSIMFVFSGIMLLYFPLIVVSIIFSICHVMISYKNTELELKNNINVK